MISHAVFSDSGRYADLKATASDTGVPGVSAAPGFCASRLAQIHPRLPAYWVLPPAQYSLSAALGQISFGTKRLRWLLPKQVPQPGCKCSEYTLKISIAVKILISAPSKMIYPPSGDPGWARPSQPDPEHPCLSAQPPRCTPGHPGPGPSHLPPPNFPQSGLPLLLPLTLTQ